jgi:hypothetical protein
LNQIRGETMKYSKAMSQTFNIKKNKTLEQISQRSPQTLNKSEKIVKFKKNEPNVTPFRKYSNEIKSDKDKMKKTISSGNLHPKSVKSLPKPTTDKIIEDELQRLININLNTLVSTINNKVKNEYDAYHKNVEDFLNNLFNKKIKRIEEITNSYENDIRRLEPVLDACIYK